MKLKLFSCAAMAVTVVLTSGCASILNEQTQAVNVSSSNGKSITGNVDGVPFQGPGIVNMTRQKKGKLVTVDTAGCTKQTAVEANVDPKFFINILTGGVFGSSTDYGTEKMWKYADNIVIPCGQ